MAPIMIPYTDYQHQFIGSLLNLVAETMEHFFLHPEMAYLLFKDYRLKEANLTSKEYLEEPEQQELLGQW